MYIRIKTKVKKEVRKISDEKYLYTLICIMSILIMIFLTGCDNGFLIEPEGEWEKYNSEYFTYYLQSEDEISEQEIEQKLYKLDNFWKNYAEIWESSVEEVVYYKFISREEVERLTGEATTSLKDKALNVNNTFLFIKLFSCII